jgi:hypothetical protein
VRTLPGEAHTIVISDGGGVRAALSCGVGRVAGVPVMESESDSRERGRAQRHRLPRWSRLCYHVNMKKRTRRTGATQTFSVSVDPETKRALRALADREFGGNLSALVTELAEEARRRLAAGAYLERQDLPRVERAEADLLQAEIDREVRAARRRRKRSAA